MKTLYANSRLVKATPISLSIQAAATRTIWPLGLSSYSVGRHSDLDIAKGLVIAQVSSGLGAIPPLVRAVDVHPVVGGAMGRKVPDFGRHHVGLGIPKFDEAVAARQAVFLATGAEAVAASWSDLLAVELVDGDLSVLVGCECSN